MSAAVPPDQDQVPPPALAAAREFVARGWRPFPVEYGGKRPAVGIRWGTATASPPSDKTLELWFGREPVNVGIACRGSGLVVLDDDTDHVDGRAGLDVRDAMTRLCEAYGQDVPVTYRVRTAKGWHWYFAAPEHVEIGNAAGLLADFGFDVRGGRGDGGYVVAAGSLHESGHVYAAEDDDADVVDLPWWLIELLMPEPEPAADLEQNLGDPNSRSRSERLFTTEQAVAYVERYGIEPLRSAEPGRRNTALNTAAMVTGHFCPAFWPVDEAAEALASIARDIGLDESEIGPTVRSGLTAGMREPYGLADPFGSASGSSAAGGTEPSTWLPVDLADGWDADHEPEAPTLLARTDGAHLIYPGRTHSIYGESESGKSWVALILAAQVLATGGTVLYIDHESDPGPIRARLRALGVTREQAGRLTYVRPDGPRDSAWAALLGRSYVAAVIDGVSVAIATEGASSDSTDETARWLEEVPRALATRTGAAVLTVDHVTKARDSRGRFAIGSQAKLNAISGAAYTARVHQPFGRGQVGELVLRVTKDRPGGVRPSCGQAGDYGTQEAARIVLDATDPARIRVEVRPWSEAGDESTDLPFGEPLESPTSWRDIDTPLPGDIVAYQGVGKSALGDLARFMRHAAGGGVGQSLADAKRELSAVKGMDGKPRHNRWAVQRAWGGLLDLSRLQPADGVMVDTGRHIWTRRDGE